MICKNEIIELNNKRACWFPVNPSSPFALCSRCDFYKVESTLKEIESNLSLITNPAFVNLCLDQKHRVLLLSALTRLQEKNHPEFERFFRSLSSERFFHDINHQVHTHSPSCRCKLYQYILKTRTFDREIQSTDMPWSCWDCLSFILKQRNMLNCYRAFSNGLVTNRIKKPESYPSKVIDCMISLHINKKDHTTRLLFDRLRRSVHETKAKEFLLEFLTTPVTIPIVFTASASEFVPSSWNKELNSSFLQKEALKAVKKRNHVFKEDLIIKTWHPDRLFPWCLDIEELKDFDH